MDGTFSTGLVTLFKVTKALACGLGPGIQCEGFRLEVEDELLVGLNLSLRNPIVSLLLRGEWLRIEGMVRRPGTQQQTMPTAISIGEKQMRHHDAPILSLLTSPKTLIAQSMRKTASMIQLERGN